VLEIEIEIEIKIEMCMENFKSPLVLLENAKVM
jgi:hypothetical protein